VGTFMFQFKTCRISRLKAGTSGYVICSHRFGRLQQAYGILFFICGQVGRYIQGGSNMTGTDFFSKP
jgi:hypothetical protein